MVKTALVVLVALTGAAAARPPPPDDDYEPDPDVHDDDSPSFNMLGFTIGVGALPLRSTDTRTMSLGLSVEHPVFARTRIVGEYDLLWLQRYDPATVHGMMTYVPRPDEHGTGHRASLGLRRELFGAGRSARMFVDGELGVTSAIVNDNTLGVAIVPGMFAGVRVGYDLYSNRDSSPSRTFENAFLVRATAVREGVGFMLGLGMYWGN